MPQGILHAVIHRFRMRLRAARPAAPRRRAMPSHGASSFSSTSSIMPRSGLRGSRQ